MAYDDLDDDELMTEEEEREELESLGSYFEEQFGGSDGSVSIINPKRMQDVIQTYKILRYLTKTSSAKVTYKLNEPFSSMGYISIVGKNLIFRSPRWFMKAVQLSDNFNVYPKTNGKVQMDFTFHGLTTEID